MNNTKQPLHQIWAKISKDNPSLWHPLIYHILDTAAVAQIMWNECLCESFKTSIASNFDLNSDETGILVSFWVGLHDIGKAGPGFQKKSESKKEFFQELGFTFPTTLEKNGFHATATTIIFKRTFSDYPRKFRNGLAYALGAHHGEFPIDGDITNYEITKAHVGDENWQQVQDEITNLTKRTLDPKNPHIFPTDYNTLNPLLFLLAGLTTTADWIASNQEYFPYFIEPIDTGQYYKLAKEKADHALKALGWTGWHATHNPLKFNILFPDYSPNIVQKAVINQTEELETPFMMIIEAATGSGKTEAALYCADTILQRDLKAGIFIAMPTQATSNQMYTRVRSFLSKRYQQDEINLHLVHGAAFLLQFNSYTPDNVYSEQDNNEGNIHSHTWFLPRKRTLLAPFGVGTVDQTLLSVLRTRHFFLRLFGLSHKVLIFDEVHAYDVYMMEIFESLLQWLNAVGTSVIILTATLPKNIRSRLLKAYNGHGEPEQNAEFPRISIADRKKISVFSTGKVASRRINLEWIGQDIESIEQKLKAKLQDQGCVAIICNRVKRAQDVYIRLQDTFKNDEVEIILFHSRYPHHWRMEIENKVLKFFGKDRQNRPTKAILIATQVIEQSLDLDFDLMISDLAPIDLLIQRIGRLHRHEIIRDERPAGLHEPTCIISAPKFSGKVPEYGPDSYIYDEYILAKTHNILKNKTKLLLPGDSDTLIEYVYSIDNDNDLPSDKYETFKKLKQNMLNDHTKSREKTKAFIVPGYKNNIIGSLQTFFGDDQNSLSSHTMNAPTREMEATIDIVCFEEKIDGLHILGQNEIIDLNSSMTLTQTMLCLQAALSINNKKVIQYFLDSKNITPPAFKDNANLRWHLPVTFREGIFNTEKFELEINKKTGLIIRMK